VFLTIEQLHDLADAAAGAYAETVLVLGLAGLRWGELAGLQVQDLVSVPGRGLRLQRSVLMSRQTGELFEDTLKNKRARTVPLVPELVPIVDRWAADKEPGEWLFGAPKGGPMSEANWQRSIRWSAATKAIGSPSCARTTFGTRARRCGSVLGQTRRSFSASSGTPRRP